MDYIKQAARLNTEQMTGNLTNLLFRQDKVWCMKNNEEILLIIALLVHARLPHLLRLSLGRLVVDTLVLG